MSIYDEALAKLQIMVDQKECGTHQQFNSAKIYIQNVLNQAKQLEQDECDKQNRIYELENDLAELHKELDELERDVKRFMELDCDDSKTWDKQTHDEFVALVEKLLKVGK